MAKQRGSYNNLCIFTDPSEQAHVFSSNGRETSIGTILAFINVNKIYPLAYK
jgi:hypothetical protein